MESKLSGAWATASNVSNRVHARVQPILNRAERFSSRVGLLRATLEVIAVALVWAAIYQSPSLTRTDASSLAFVTVVASSVFLGAFRLSPSVRSWAGLGREIAAAGAVIAPAFVVQLWMARSLTGVDAQTSEVVLAVAVSDVAVFVVGRFLVVVMPWWLRFNRQRLRWQLVHAHIVVVLIVLSAPIAVLVGVYVRHATRATAYAGNGAVESAVVRIAYAVIPGLALVVVTFGLTLIVIVPPSIALSYVVARRMTRRLESLAIATTAIREGDRAARVSVQGFDEVAQLQANFNAMASVLQTALAETAEERDKIAQLLDQRRELVASVSHELRTPLTIIRGYLDSSLAQNGALTSELHRDLTVMHGEALRLQRLIDDLFALSRAEVGSLTLHPRDADAGAILQRCAEATSAGAWRTHRVEVLVEPSGPLPSIRVDPDRLEQALFNLINNAVRHSPPGGLVHLSAVLENGFVNIAVADTGEGIAPEEIHLIWDRFYRGRNAKDARGSGIGLAIVRELTEAMGGDVSVSSMLGDGTTFTLRFPIAADLSETVKISQSIPRNSPAEAQAQALISET